MADSNPVGESAPSLQIHDPIASVDANIKGGVTTGEQGLDDYDFDINPEILANWSTERNDIMSEHPMFMTEIPRDPEEFQKNPHLVALQELVYGEKTAKEVATQFKDMGNEFLTDGHGRFDEAVKAYTRGLEEKAEDDRLNAILYSNRAQAHINLKNFVEAVDDARKAVGLDATIVKAFYRGGKASYMLKLFRQAVKFCDGGLEQESTNSTLLSLKKQAEERINEQEARRLAEKIAADKEKEEKLHQGESTDKYVQEMKTQGIEVGHVLYAMDAVYTAKGRLRNGQIVAPLAVLYDEYCTSDFIEETRIAEESLNDHLDMLFPADRRPDWDTDGKYKVSNLRAYLEIPPLDTHDQGSPVVIVLDASKPLIDQYKRGRRISKIPVVHVLVKDSPAEKAFLQTVHLRRD